MYTMFSDWSMNQIVTPEYKEKQTPEAVVAQLLELLRDGSRGLSVREGSVAEISLASLEF